MGAPKDSSDEFAFAATCIRSDIVGVCLLTSYFVSSP